MVQKEMAKASALILSLTVILSSFIYIPDWHAVGVYRGCSIIQRIGYSFFHASLLHALINAWCMLSVIFIYEAKLWRIAIAFLIAIVVPDYFLDITPTVGLSAVCYALLGSITLESRRKMYFLSCMALYILVGFIIPGINAWIHLYAYMAGLLVGLLNTPILCLKK